jgi:hypothetical protein
MNILEFLPEIPILFLEVQLLSHVTTGNTLIMGS